jgi:DNA-binding MarR family transcriptional regulator
MGIENAIQQRNFRNEYQKANINLIYTYHWLVERGRKFLANDDITSQQYNILRILRGSGKPLSTLQIRDRMLDKMSDTSRIVDRLVLKELVEKRTCAQDKRLVDVSITLKGLALLEKLDASNEEMDNVLNNLTDDEARLLNMLLDKMRND